MVFAMDVDLLRPGTVPISPDTILWFEFLLNPSLLEKHLNKEKPDPSPTDLIISFLSIASEKKDEEVLSVSNDLTDTKRYEETGMRGNRKNIALRILALKVAAFLKWDLEVLKILPLPMQLTLLQSLLFLALDYEMDVSQHSELDFANETSQVLFAVTLYHRWVLRAIMHSKLTVRQNRLPNVSIPGLQEPGNFPVNMLDDILRRLESQAPDSVELLNSLINSAPSIVPVFDSFVFLTEDSQKVIQNWDSGAKISCEEFQCQLYYDIASYLFFREQYIPAKENLSKAACLFEELKSVGSDLYYCNVDTNALDGYCHALRLSSGKGDLLSQLQHSVHNHYTGIISILQNDNLQQEIPQMYRDVLELDIQGALSSGKFTVARDLLLHIQILNTVCRALKGLPTYTNFWHYIQQGKFKAVDMFFSAILPVLQNADSIQKQKLKQLLVCGISEYPPLYDSILNNTKIKDLFMANEITELRSYASRVNKDFVMTTNSASSVAHAQLYLKTDWELINFDLAGDIRVECGSLEQQLIRTYDIQEIHNLLVRLSSLNPGKVLWKVNNKWTLPIPLQGVVVSLPRGIVQDYCFILLAKSRELTVVKDFKRAQEFLSAVEKDAKHGGHLPSNMAYKLVRLVLWESLLVQIVQFHSEWPSPGFNTEPLITGCKQCLSALKSGESSNPRLEIQEQCALCLLNLGQWDYLSSFDKRWNSFELSSALANACQDVMRFKGNKKVCEDAWDIVLSVFGPPPQQKRSSSGTSTVLHRDSPTHCSSPTSRFNLYQTLSCLRDPTVLAVAISLLARLFNILRKEPNLDLNMEYCSLWPSTLSNASSYYTRGVSEMLSQLLVQALQYHPNNTSWLKLLADLNFVLGHYTAALKCYLEVAVIVSDFFNQPMPRAIMDDYVFKRMIKCCTHLQCHTQAAVLCQFLEEVDYTTAFKSLGDNKSSASCSDAMDAYYNCIWDTTILEFLVYLHNKRGETQRRQQAIKVIGLLELNANNNEEIQREAANVRKARFMRAMARQYLS